MVDRADQRVAEIFDRVTPHFTIGDACWEWTASKTPTGYGYAFVHGRTRRAHRVMYEFLRGPVPEGLELDHLCRNRACVNPAHLEPVTHAENMRRGKAGERQAAKTHCPQGHAYDETNTYHRRDRVSRNCRACVKEAMRRYRERQRG